MEFDEMKKVWDAQNNQPVYNIDEKALLDRIQSKMDIVLRATSISEWCLILINLIVGIVLLNRDPFRSGNIFLSIEAGWMFLVVVYLAINRSRRIKASRQFDRSVRGDLDHSISLLDYQMRISQIVSWNLLPLGLIMIGAGWESGKLWKVSLVILISFSLALYVTRAGYRSNKKRKRILLELKEKLDADI